MLILPSVSYKRKLAKLKETRDNQLVNKNLEELSKVAEGKQILCPILRKQLRLMLL